VSSRHTLLVALPVAALLLAGCGGGGEETTESTAAPTTVTTTALTRDELIEQGDAICAEVNAAVGTVGASSAETGSPATQSADLYSGMVDSLKSLGVPQEADGYTEFSTAADELATAEGEVKLASERGDMPGLEAAESNSSTALTSFQNAASEYGFEDCSEGPSAPSAAVTPESGEAGSAETPEAVEPEVVEPEPEVAPEPAPETGGAGGAVEEGGGTAGGTEGGGGGGTTGGESGGIGPG
jgi:hypothetical protein